MSGLGSKVVKVWQEFDLLAAPPPPNGRDQAAVLIALYEDAEGDARLILTKRPDTMPTHAGHVAFPGGRPDPTDGGPRGTALREAHEEVGLKPEDVEVVGYLPPIDTVQFKLLVVPVVGILASVPTLFPSAREVVRVFHPRVADLSDESNWTTQTWREHRVWFYDLEGESLWGATAMMTRRLLGLESY